MNLKEQKGFFSELTTEELLEKDGGYGWAGFVAALTNGCLGSVYQAKKFWDAPTTSTSGTCTR